jgi:hypothetical protein
MPYGLRNSRSSSIRERILRSFPSSATDSIERPFIPAARWKLKARRSSPCVASRWTTRSTTRGYFWITSGDITVTAHNGSNPTSERIFNRIARPSGK